MVAVGFLSINDQICIHGVKSKLSSTFYQLLQASLIYLSKLFAILTSRDNILKVQISEKKKKTCPIIEFISPKNTWAIFQTPNKCLSSALFENHSIFHFTVPEKMRLFRAVFKHCAKIGIHFSCLLPPLLKCHFFQDPFFCWFYGPADSLPKSTANFHFLGNLSTICHFFFLHCSIHENKIN